MIRKKKNEIDTEDRLAPLSEIDQESEMTPDEELEDGDSRENDSKSEKKNKKEKKFFRLGRKNKKDDAENGASALQDSESQAYDSFEHALNLEQEGMEYLDKKEEKKISLKKILLIAGIAVVLIAGIVFFIVKNMSSGGEGKAYVQSVGVLTGLGSGNGGSNRYTGVVEPQDSWKIVLDADMSVAECFVKVGDEVKKGDKLFVYNTEELKLNQEKKELEISTMQNEINQLTKDISSYESDLKGASSSEKIELQTQILTAQTTIKKDQFAIKSSKEEIEKIKKNIKDATVKSKMDGVVKSINAALGTHADDDDANNGFADPSASDDNSTYMNILAVGDYRVKGTVRETNAPSMGEGDMVIVRSRTDDTTWKGTVQTMKTDSVAENNENSDESMDDMGSLESASQYNFYVVLKDDTGLMMGQHVFIEPDNGQDEEREGFWISSAFLVVEDDNYYVWADDGHDRLEKRKVTIGEYDETLDEYQVLDGISLSDYIACDDMDIKEGMKTTKVDPYAEEDIEDEGDGPVADPEQYDDFEDGEGFDEDMGMEDDMLEENFDDADQFGGPEQGLEDMEVAP